MFWRISTFFLICTLTVSAHADFERVAYDNWVKAQFPDSFSTLENEQRARKPRGTDGLGVRLFSDPKEDATDWALLVVDPIIDHVWTSTASVKNEETEPFEAKVSLPSLPALTEKLSRGRFSEQGGTPGKMSFTAVILGKGVESLVQGKALSLPLLVSGKGIYRAQSACLSENGVACAKPLDGAVTSALRADTAISEVPLLNQLSASLKWKDFFTKPLLVLVEYQLISQTTTDPRTVTQVPGLVHPGYSPWVLKLEKALFDRYQAVFRPAGKGPTEFVKKVRIGDCDTTAITLATLNPDQHFLLALGNLPTPTGFLDITTENHGWNAKVRLAEGAVESLDMTPGPSFGLTFALDEAAFQKLLPKIDALNAQNFSIESLLVENPGVEALAKLSGEKHARLSVRDIVAPGFKLDNLNLELAPNYRPDILEKTHLSVSTDTTPLGRIWGQYFKNENESVFLMIEKHIYLGRPGELVFRSYRLADEPHDRVLLTDDVPAEAREGKSYFTFNFDLGAAAARSFRSSIVDYKVARATGRRGYLWPHLTEQQMLAI